jgi:hypothetical protein
MKNNPVVLRADLLKELRRMTPLQRSFAMNWLAVWMDDLGELQAAIQWAKVTETRCQMIVRRYGQEEVRCNKTASHIDPVTETVKCDDHAEGL